MVFYWTCLFSIKVSVSCNLNSSFSAISGHCVIKCMPVDWNKSVWVTSMTYLCFLLMVVNVSFAGLCVSVWCLDRIAHCSPFLLWPAVPFALVSALSDVHGGGNWKVSLLWKNVSLVLCQVWGILLLASDGMRPPAKKAVSKHVG